MKKSTLGSLILGACALLILVAIYSTYSVFVGFEEDFRARNLDAQQAYGACGNKIKSLSLPIEHLAETQQQLMETAIARYGSDTGAAMLWVTEQNMQMHPGAYKQINRAIEDCFDDLSINQKAKLDIARVYRKKLRSPFGGLVADTFGFPQEVAYEELDFIVSSADAKKAWATGEAEPIDIFSE